MNTPAFLTYAATGALLFAGACAAHIQPCGGNRGGVLGLTDAGAERIRYDTVVASSITEQVMLPALEVSGETPRQPSELTVYRIEADLIGYRLDPQGDMVLLLREPGSQTTMTAEIPDPDCPDMAKSTRGALFAAARNWISTQFGLATQALRRVDPPLPITLTGVGAYATIDTRIEGMASNNRVIHPVLRIGDESIRRRDPQVTRPSTPRR